MIGHMLIDACVHIHLLPLCYEKLAILASCPNPSWNVGVFHQCHICRWKAHSCSEFADGREMVVAADIINVSDSALQIAWMLCMTILFFSTNNAAPVALQSLGVWT